MRDSLSVVELRALVLEQHRDRVHRLERPADAARALARAAHDGAELAGLLGDERRDDVALAELHGPDDERLALDAGSPHLR